MRLLTLLLSVAALATLLLVIWRSRARPLLEARVPGEDWQRTDELIRDPATGRTLRVWIDPSDGKRYTVADVR